MRHMLNARLKAFLLFSPIASLLAWGMFQLFWNSPLILYDAALVLPWAAVLLVHVLAGQRLRRRLPRPAAREGLVFVAVLTAAYAGAVSFFYTVGPGSFYLCYQILSRLNPLLSALESLGFLLPWGFYENVLLTVPGGLTALLFCAAVPPALFLLGMCLPAGDEGDFPNSMENDG